MIKLVYGSFGFIWLTNIGIFCPKKWIKTRDCFAHQQIIIPIDKYSSTFDHRKITSQCIIYYKVHTNKKDTTLFCFVFPERAGLVAKGQFIICIPQNLVMFRYLEHNSTLCWWKLAIASRSYMHVQPDSDCFLSFQLTQTSANASCTWRNFYSK